MHQWLHWFQSRLYHKLVLSHVLLLVLFLVLVGITGHLAFRAFSRLMYHENFQRQSALLFQSLREDLEEVRKRLGDRADEKAIWKAWTPVLHRHVANGARFLVTLVVVSRPNGRCVLEAYPPTLMDMMVRRKWPRRRGWRKLLRSPQIVLRTARDGICPETSHLGHLRFGFVFAVSTHTYQVQGADKLTVSFHSLAPFRHRPPPSAIIFPIILVFGLACVLVFPINRNITSPLQELTHSVKRIQGGELAQEVPVRGHDEVGILARSIEDMRRSLLEYQEQRRVLLSDISHEIRTPLTRIRTVAESIADGLMREEDELTQAMEGICQQVDEIDQLMGDLLDIARFELSKANQLEKNSFNLIELCTEVHRAFQPLVAAEQLRFVLEVHELKALSIEADRRRLRQVLNNLLQNAVRHSPPQGEIRLEIATESRAEWQIDTSNIQKPGVFLCVLDQGPGIPEIERERVFERLVRLDPSRSRHTGGQGLGLAIVRQIVKAHGGLVGVKEAPGGGACFWVWLPEKIEFVS